MIGNNLTSDSLNKSKHDDKLKYLLTRYHGKEEITCNIFLFYDITNFIATKSQNSIYQQGFGMIFCNPGPIATARYLVFFMKLIN